MLQTFKQHWQTPEHKEVYMYRSVNVSM
uniref:Uncharacterized protein n=1 Tax=Arundo donax TaxID=35708 RepID=A0A0A9LEV2_ARUDO